MDRLACSAVTRSHVRRRRSISIAQRSSRFSASSSGVGSCDGTPSRRIGSARRDALRDDATRVLREEPAAVTWPEGRTLSYAKKSHTSSLSSAPPSDDLLFFDFLFFVLLLTFGQRLSEEGRRVVFCVFMLSA